MDCSNVTEYFNIGLVNYKNKEYHKALPMFLLAASKQNAMSQFYLGRMFENGQGTLQDIKQAHFYYLQSGNEGCGMAQHYLGQLNRHGCSGMPKDYSQAVNWFTREFDKSKSCDYLPGHSYHLTGQIYEEGGFGIEKSYDMALYWYHKADENRYAGAAFSIGLIYRKGKGVKQNYKQAIDWFLKAASNKDYAEKAYYNLAVIFIAGGNGIEKNFRQALDWLMKSVDRGSTHGMLAIGKIFRDGGFGVDKNHKKALDWFLEAAKTKSLTAYYNIGLIYRSGGYGVDISYPNSQYWTMKGARIGHLDSQYGMGLLYTFRTDEKQDFRQAFSWFQSAANNKHSHSQFYVGFFYEKGYGVDKSYENAMSWYKKSADNGQFSAYSSIGLLYHKGLGVAQDHGKALEMYRKVINMTGGHLDYGSAFHGIGLLYQEGKIFPQSHETAMHYFLMAAELNSAEACNSIGNIYNSGDGVIIDHKNAFKWYSKCTKLVEDNFDFCDEGLFNLGLMYFHGLGTHVSFEMALVYLKKSVKQGNDKAQTYIDRVHRQHAQEAQGYQLLLDMIYSFGEEASGNKENVDILMNHSDGVIEHGQKELKQNSTS
ncbi:hypothetical protein INT47_000962 [Mucor saturninus]|uniref:Uncharacterized protein n=1 Tax=Mucor saturninus TaxID=64648 RepID=A0A8H7RNL2_9FUNG|nr:hypothetical protein INT47_000962 [Mucor saturninus]